MTPEVAPMLAQNTTPLVIGGMTVLFMCLMIRELVRKGIALWKAGTQKRLARFVCLFIFNTAGILPILFLAFFQKKGKK